MPRRRRSGLAVWLQQTTTPVFALDRRRVLLYFNRGCEELTGWLAADVIGRTCDLADEPDPQVVECLTGALAPPAEVLAGQALAVPRLLQHRGGGTHSRDIQFVPLTDGEEVHILGLILSRLQPPHSPRATTPAAELRLELASLRAALAREYGWPDVIARTPAMRRVLEQLRVAAVTSAAVFLQGESGTGREFLARVVHQHGPGRLHAFVPLDCSRLTAFELQRSLQRVFQQPDDREPLDPAFLPGAVFLRAVTQLPRDVQVKLLHWIDDRAARGEPPIRLFSCDEESPAAAVRDERLIPELAERLRTLAIEVPPLRERQDDLPLLAQFFLERINRDQDQQIGGFANDVSDQFRKYNWPGNVRELAQVVSESHASTAGPLVTSANLPFRFRTGVDAQRVGPAEMPPVAGLQARLDEFERREIELVLEQCRGNRAQAARQLGLTRTKLYRRMEQLGIADE
jgi:DNA-binding NtrC family response regulator